MRRAYGRKIFTSVQNHEIHPSNGRLRHRAAEANSQDSLFKINVDLYSFYSIDDIFL